MERREFLAGVGGLIAAASVPAALTVAAPVEAGIEAMTATQIIDSVFMRSKAFWLGRKLTGRWVAKSLIGEESVIIREFQDAQDLAYFAYDWHVSQLSDGHIPQYFDGDAFGVRQQDLVSFVNDEETYAEFHLLASTTLKDKENPEQWKSHSAEHLLNLAMHAFDLERKEHS